MLRGPFTRWPRAADAALAAAMFLVAAFVVEKPNGDLGLRPISDAGEIAVGAIAAGSLYWRRSHPLLVLGLTLLATTLATAAGYSELIGITMLVALYSVGRHVDIERQSQAALGGALAVTGIFFGKPLGEVVLGVLVLTTAWYIGRRIRIRGEYEAAKARRAVAEERTRIARELHDVVAHRVSVMTVQAGAARTVAASDPQRAQQAMEAVETAGRQALDELRHLLGVLRPESEAALLVPQPGLADVPRLLEQFRDAGLDVSLTMARPKTNLPARVNLSTYRIVQEALTNVLKHAGPGARTEVHLGTDDDSVAIEVIDDGRGATILPGAGHGIAGMRERAHLLGGTLEAGPRPDGGFQVIARLPIGEEPA